MSIFQKDFDISQKYRNHLNFNQNFRKNSFRVIISTKNPDFFKFRKNFKYINFRQSYRKSRFESQLSKNLDFSQKLQTLDTSQNFRKKIDFNHIFLINHDFSKKKKKTATKNIDFSYIKYSLIVENSRCQNLKKSTFQSQFLKNLNFSQNHRKISISVKIGGGGGGGGSITVIMFEKSQFYTNFRKNFENLNFSLTFRKILILVEIFEKYRL